MPMPMMNILKFVSLVSPRAIDSISHIAISVFYFCHSAMLLFLSSAFKIHQPHHQERLSYFS